MVENKFIVVISILVLISIIAAGGALIYQYKQHYAWQKLYYDKDYQYESLKQSTSSDLNNLRSSLSDTKSSLSNMNNMYYTCSQELNYCNLELSKFRSSTDYYYSEKIIINNDIKRIAGKNTESFTSDYCEQYDYNFICTEYNIYGQCIIGYDQPYCSKEDMDKKIYAETEYSGWEEQYNARAIIANFVYVRDNSNYALGGSPAGEGSQTSVEMLSTMSGKCDEKSILLVALLRSVGVEANLVMFPKPNHMIVAVKDNNLKGTRAGEYLFIDPTCRYCTVSEMPEWDYEGYKILEYYETRDI